MIITAIIVFGIVLVLLGSPNKPGTFS